MAYRFYGGSPADVATDASGNVTSSVALQVWTARTGGTQPPLKDAGGATITTVTPVTTTTDKGLVVFQADADGYDYLWLDRQDGSNRLRVNLRDPGPLDGIYTQLPATADQVLFVSARGSDTNSGLSWKKAKATVAGALAVVGTTTGYRIEIGQGTITETVAWGTLPSNTVIRGQGKFATTILKAFNGTMFTPGQGVNLSDFTIDAQGATYTGRICSITGTLGAQTFDRLKLLNGDLECIWFGYQAGSGFVANNCDIWRYNAASGSGRYSVVVEDVQQLAATPRSFHQLASGGQATFDFGGANDFFVTQSFLNDLHYSANSAGVHIAASRLASPQATTSIRGSNNTIVACDVYSALQIESGYGGNVIGPNAYQNAPVDLSGLATNKIIHDSYAYTPVLTTSGTAPSLGNGTITGVYSRAGTVIIAEVEFTVGSTTTLGTGDLRFSLPYTRSSGQTSITGQAIIFPAGGSTQYTAAVQIVGAVGYVRLIRDTTGAVSGTSPATLAAGSNIRIGITYRQ
ncbi:MAG: hypothetical protein ACXVXO_00760 [Mycobacteriaceae bacterium]